MKRYLFFALMCLMLSTMAIAKEEKKKGRALTADEKAEVEKKTEDVK